MTLPMRIPTAPMALGDFLALPEQEAPTEVVEGVLVVTAMPLGTHQRVVSRLDRLLNDACPAGFESLPGADWVLWEVPRLKVRQPDVLVVACDLATMMPQRTAPLLAVEVVSAESFERDVITKRAEYAQAGLQHYWVVIPRGEAPADCEIVVYASAKPGDELVEVARACGDERLERSEPFSVSLCPADLVVTRT